MPLHNEPCLALYEQGAARHAIDRALLLASTVGGTENEPSDAGDWADQPVGRRDARLLALRCAWFGPQFDAVLACPACRELHAVTLDLRALDAPAANDPLDVQVAGHRFRRPTSRDLAAIAAASSIEQAATQLLDRLCLGTPPHTGWSAEERDAVEAALDRADPLAHVTIALRCDGRDGCGHGWQAPLDIAAVLWDEVAAQAQAVVSEVHLLASAYGWSEGEILALPPARRRLYLQQVSS